MLFQEELYPQLERSIVDQVPLEKHIKMRIKQI